MNLEAIAGLPIFPNTEPPKVAVRGQLRERAVEQFYTYLYGNSPGLGCSVLGVQFFRVR